MAFKKGILFLLEQTNGPSNISNARGVLDDYQSTQAPTSTIISTEQMVKCCVSDTDIVNAAKSILADAQTNQQTFSIKDVKRNLMIQVGQNPRRHGNFDIEKLVNGRKISAVLRSCGEFSVVKDGCNIAHFRAYKTDCEV